MIDLNRFKARCDGLAKILAVVTAFTVTFSTSLVAIGFILIGILWLLSGNWRDKFARIRRMPAAVAALVLLALVFVGMFYGPANMSESLNRFDSYLNTFLFIVIFAIVITDDVWRQRVFATFLAGMVITMILSYLTASHLISLPFGDPTRGEVFHYYITQNYFMAIAVYVAFVWFLFHGKELSRMQKMLIISAILLGAINVVFVTTARTGPVVLSAMILTFLIDRYRLKGILIGLAAMVAIAAVAYTLSSRFQSKVHESAEQFQTIAKGERKDLPGRATFFLIGSRIVRDHPVFGVGTGGLDRVFHEYAKRLRLRQWQFPSQVSLHSAYSMIVAELGLLGLLVFLVFIAMVVRQTKRLPEPHRIIGLGIVVAFTVDSFINSAATNVNEGQLFALLIGAIIGKSLELGDSTTSGDRGPTKESLPEAEANSQLG